VSAAAIATWQQHAAREQRVRGSKQRARTVSAHRQNRRRRRRRRRRRSRRRRRTTTTTTTTTRRRRRRRWWPCLCMNG